MGPHFTVRKWPRSCRCPVVRRRASMGPHFTVRKWWLEARGCTLATVLQWGRTSQCGNGQPERMDRGLSCRFNGAALHSAEMVVSTVEPNSTVGTLQWGRTSQCGNGRSARHPPRHPNRFNGAALHSAEMVNPTVEHNHAFLASMGPHFTVRKWDGGAFALAVEVNASMGPHFTVRKWPIYALRPNVLRRLQWGRTSQCGNGSPTPPRRRSLGRCFNGAALHSAEMVECFGRQHGREELQWGRTSQCGNGPRPPGCPKQPVRFNGAALHSAEMA